MKTKDIQLKVIEGNRAVAVFDILGFSQFVRNADLSSLPEILQETYGLSRAASVSADFVRSILISDTIVLYALEEDDIISPAMVVISSSNLLNVFARSGTLLRGALTFDHIFVDEEKNVLIGPALVRAYELAQLQDWAGAMVDPQCSDVFSSSMEHGPEASRSNLVKYPAPLKTGKREEFLCIGWMHRARLTRNLLYALFFKERGQTPEHTVYRKYRNTLEYLDYCLKTYSADFAQ